MSITEIMDNKMPSLTEWLEQAGVADTTAFRQEDNDKRDRLEVLYQITGLVYDRPAKFSARELKNRTSNFLDFLATDGEKLCALRLIPLSADMPKLRVRGKTLNENLTWFDAQNIDVDKYKVEVVPHNGADKYAAIFLINEQGVIGEIVSGLHWQLTQGLYETPPIYFNFDFINWHFSSQDEEAQKWVKKAVTSLQIEKTKQNSIQQKFTADFTDQGYLKGYFEFVVWSDDQLIFIDYNRVIYKMLKDIRQGQVYTTSELTGICASPGTAVGKAKIVMDPKNTDFTEGEILICPMTMIDYVPLMKKAIGIITEQGNILSHAAIVARELRKPCLVGVKNITTKIKNGQNITLDADKGQIVLN